MIVLSGDVGGTHARLALVDMNGAASAIVAEGSYPSAEYPGPGPIVKRFLKEQQASPERACFGIAGPVVGDRARVSNLPWVVDATDLGREIGIARTMLINDFAAVGYGIARLGPDDLVTLQAGIPVPHGPVGLIGAGTGLGEGYLLWNGSSYDVYPSEGGHGDFAPRDERQTALLLVLAREFGHVSYERIVSGAGLARVYRFLADIHAAPEQKHVADEMQHDDPAAVVTRRALDGSDTLCDMALDMFCSIFGAEAGNLALRVLATGGVYIAGGIAPIILPRLKDGGFLTAFGAKGRLSEVTDRVPVHVIVNQEVGLLGAAAVAARA